MAVELFYGDSEVLHQQPPKVLYISSSFWLLEVESRDFSHAEKEELLAKLSKSTQNDNLGPF